VPSSLVEVDWDFRDAYCLQDDEPWWWGSMLLWNVGMLQQDYTRYISKYCKLHTCSCENRRFYNKLISSAFRDMSMGWDYYLWTVATNGPFFHPQINMSFRAMWKDTDRGKTEDLGENPVPVPPCPQQILHGLTPKRTEVSVMRGRWVTGR
jgi:hypothetical protein